MSPKTLRRAADSHDQRITAIVRAGAAIARQQDIDFAVGRYLRCYYARVAIEDLSAMAPRDLAGAALHHLKAGLRRRRGEHQIQIYNPERKVDGWESDHTIVEIVNDDMPFLVDSLGMAIERAGLGVHLTVHPLIPLRRQRGRVIEAGFTAKNSLTESFIRLEIDRISSPETIERVRAEIERTLSDVRVAVADWVPMRAKLRACAKDLDAQNLNGDASLISESTHLLEWMADDRFTILGYHEYRLQRNKAQWTLLPVRNSGLGLLAESRHKASKVSLTAAMKKQARNNEPLIITKANSRSTIHRASYLDYIGVKVFDKSGSLVGERRFIGLFTSLAYSESPRNIPLLRLKVHRIIDASGLDTTGHRGKALTHILDNFPRDDLFQSSIPDLSRTITAILNLQDRRQVRLFLRRDAFRRFFSCLIYVPKDKYNTRIRHRIEALLLENFSGVNVDSTVEIGDGVLARLQCIVETIPDENKRVDVVRLEQRIREAVVGWTDHLRDELVTQFGEEDGLDYFERYGEVFPLAYQEDMGPDRAAEDVDRLHRVLADDGAPRYFLERDGSADQSLLSFKAINTESQLALSDVLPVLENLGARVIEERPYRLRLGKDVRLWVQVFALEMRDPGAKHIKALNERFSQCFADIINARAENDGLNQLVVEAGIEPLEIPLVRSYVKYLLQLGLAFSQRYVETVLAAQPRFVDAFVTTFYAHFDPALTGKRHDATRQRARAALHKRVQNATTLDEDRILRALENILLATVRTNFFQNRDPQLGVLAFKLRSKDIDEAPRPRPEFEIFIYSPQVEGVHLRAGSVARGGIRWSDRREDFRTEVLGLMKAQTVKNTVIVPTGAKGGFVAKRLPENGNRDDVQAEVVLCYRRFIGGLLDVTDNLVNDRIVHPQSTRCLDGDDPYLVVAADKGTAKFSDIANEISESRDFWLGDAFASGGSAGYDHKKMGITARGAWEAVRRHFRELGLNTDTDPFDVVAIGDMGGDVFGNGMLLSKTLRLRVAFNHLHIFIDPNPDAAASYRERVRLFKCGGGWDQYDTQLISRGGGIFNRHEKRIPLSREIRTMLDIDAKFLSPLELIRALLKMPTDLLWNGGIGTYVKADSESHVAAGDRSNDSLRIDASELKARVVGEGGNLGLTQRARVAFALASGKINTDFIDNSAGVDSSDREVNIKILLSLVATKKRMARSRRDVLLAQMTDAVAEKVLRNNYLQTQSLSMVELRARERLQEYTQLIRSLEGSGLLHRTLEGLPDEKQLTERRRQRKGLTRPELAVLLSYAKIDLYDGLAGRSIIRQNYHLDELSDYFPEPLPTRYRELLIDHRLSNEILATRITNSIVNRMGPTFARRLMNDTGASAVDIARTYAVIRDITGARELWSDIEQLDYAIPANHQYEMMFDIARHLRHASYWLIRRRGGELHLDPLLQEFGPRMRVLYKSLPSFLHGEESDKFDHAAAHYATLGASETLAARLASLGYTRTLLDIVEIAGKSREPSQAAELYFELGRSLSLNWLKRSVEALEADGQWQALARSSLRDTLNDCQRSLSSALLRKGAGSSAHRVTSWLAEQGGTGEAYTALIRDLRRSESRDFATLSVAAERLRSLLSHGQIV